MTFLEGEVAQFWVEKARSSLLVEHEWAETVVWA